MGCTVSAILSVMDAYGYPDEPIRKMKMVLVELLANAIQHGNKKDPTREVTVGYAIDSRKLIVAIMDEGNGFRPEDVPDPTLPENLEKDSGRGIFIARNFVDSMEYNAIGNRVTITKFHPYG